MSESQSEKIQVYMTPRAMKKLKKRKAEVCLSSDSEFARSIILKELNRK